MDLDPAIALLLLTDPRIKFGFLAWLTADLRRLSQKNNKLAFLQTFELKMGGATRSSLASTALKTRYSAFMLTVL